MHSHTPDHEVNQQETVNVAPGSLTSSSDANNGQPVDTSLYSLKEGIVHVADGAQIPVPYPMAAIKTANSFDSISTLVAASNEIGHVHASQMVAKNSLNESNANLLNTKCGCETNESSLLPQFASNLLESIKRDIKPLLFKDDAFEARASMKTTDLPVGTESGFATAMSRTASDSGSVTTLTPGSSVQSMSFKIQAQYWRQALADAPSLLDLPTDRPRPVQRSFTADQLAIHLGVPLVQSLKKLSQERDVDLRTTLMTGWSSVLSRLSGQDDIVVGIINDSKEKGSVPNIMPLRIDLSEDPNTAQMLDRVAVTFQAAKAHQGFLFENTVDAEQPSHENSQDPLIQVAFQWHDDDLNQVSLDDVTTQFALEVHLQETGNEILGYLKYSTALFDGPTIERHVGYLQKMLEAMAADVTQPIAAVDLLSSSEKDLLLQTWNVVDEPPLEHRCIHQLFEDQAAHTPDAVAVVYENQTLTYAELNARANRLAHHLIDLGVKPDTLVALSVERSMSIVIGILAILKAGGAYVPLDPVYASERLSDILSDASPSIILADKHGRNTIGEVALAPLTVVDPTLQLDGPISNPQVSSLDPHHLAYVIYTSGSTGKPKGVMVEHAQVTRLFDATAVWYQFNERDTWCMIHSYSFDVSVWELWGSLRYGGKLVIPSHHVVRSPEDLYGLICEQGITVLNMTPSAFKPMIRCQAESNLRDKLRFVVLAGEALEPASLHPWYATRPEDSPVVVNMYGTTETTVHATYRPMRQEDCARAVSQIGERIPDLKLYVLDRRGQPAPLGVVGELCIGGSGVTRGYLNRPELTAERFPLDPFTKKDGARMYRTGDLGRFLPDGGLIFLGRNDHQVKIRGFRIELGEIEARLVDHPLVKDAAVFALDDGSDKRLVAYVVAEPTEGLAQTLRSHAAARLPDYMIPTAFVRLDVLPLTANGKLDRRALPEPDSDALVTEKYEAPEGATETALAVIWAELLKISRVGRHDNFFMLGGHSLLAVQMIERLRRIGLGLSIRALFEKPTLSALALSLNQYQTEAATPQNLITPDTTRLTPEMLPLIDLTQDDIDNISKQVKGGVSNIQDIYSLAPLQDGILFHHLLATKGDPYLLTISLTFDSRELLDRYLDAVKRVVIRHDILRTAIMWEDLSSPAQVVLRDAPLSITELSLDSADGPIAEQLLQIVDPRKYRIDLTQAPLTSYIMAQDIDGRWMVVQLLHHMIGDHSTLEEMNREIQEILRGQGESLPTPQPFRNLIAQTLSGPNDVEHEQFFTEMLAEIDTPALPFGLSDVHRDGLNVIEYHRPLPQDLNVRLRGHAKRIGVSVASLCHLAWAQVIARTSGQQRVVFGTVLFGRMQAGSGADRALGLFINTLPVRVDVESIGVQESVSRTQTTLATLLEHEHASLSLAQRCSSVPAGIPLFSSLLNYRHNEDVTGNNATVAGMVIGHEQERTNYPFVMNIEDYGQTLGLTAQIVQPFDAARITDYMQQALESLANALEHTPNMPIQELEILPLEERDLLLHTWNATDVFYPDQVCIHQMFEDQAARTPDAVAIVYEDQTLTYDELNARANRLAHQLIGLGVNPDALVALCLERSPAMVVGMLAILKAGGAYVPIDPAYASDRLRQILADAAPKVLLADATGRAALGETAIASLAVIDPNELSGSTNTNPHLDELASHHLAYVIYTSGSTGTPKGVMISHSGACNYLHWAVQTYAPKRGSVVSSSISFDATVTSIWTPLLYGSSVTLLKSGNEVESLESYVRQAQGEGLLKITPMHLDLMGRRLQADGVKPQVDVFVIGGEALSPSTVALWQSLQPGVRLVNEYGPTETVVGCSVYDMRAPLPYSSSVPIGRPIANTRLYVLDTRGQPVPLGAVGELYIGGAGVARGYLNRPDLTDKSFLHDPFNWREGARMYRTGDLVRYQLDGQLEYLGRNDHQVKIRGFRIELGEIEARLIDHPLVKDVAVLALGDGSDKRLVAYVVAEPTEGLVQTLRSHAAARLPDYMTPAAFVRLDVLPLTSNGKLDRRALPEPDSEALVTEKYEAPEGATETALAVIWAELLKIDRVGRHDNFFMLGGHSLLAVRLMNRVSALGAQIQLSTLFASPVLSEFANVVDKQIAQADQSLNDIKPVPRDGALLPSFAQQRLWFLAQMEGVSEIYHMPMHLRLQGALDRGAWQRSLNALFARHESLRSIFVTVGGQPQVQLLPAQSGIPVLSDDLRGEQDVDGRLHGLCATEVSAPFDLEKGPLIRARLIQVADDEFVFLLTQHHIVSDGWSMGLLARELSELYTANSTGRSDSLPPLAIQYPDYAAWQREWLAGDRLKEQSNFWRKALANTPVLIALPTDRPRPPQQSFAGARVPIRVDSHTTLALKRISQQHGATLFMTILAAWSAVLSRLSGQDDVVIGTPSANRNRHEIEHLIGFFVNTLVLRVDLSGEPSVSQLLERVRRDSLEAQAHQDLPFEQVVEIAKPPRRMDQTPLFQVMFAWQNNDADALSLPGIVVKPMEANYDIVKFDLELEMYEAHNEIVGCLKYSTALFDGPTIERHVGYLQKMLEAMAADVTQPIAAVDLLSSSEKDLLLQTWNVVDEPPLEHRCIHQLFEDQAAHTPDAVAVVYENQTLTYAELNARANRLAHHLIDLGVKPDTLVALSVERSMSIVIGILAILKAGGAYVPLDPVYASERLSDILSDASPSIILADKHGRNTIGEVALAPLTVVDPTLQLDGPISNPQVSSLDPHHLAYVIYTSGSTGKPKGVMVEHAQVTRLFDATAVWYQFNERDTWCMLHSYSFDFSVWELWGSLRYGGRLIIPSHHIARSPEDLYGLICEQGITVLNMTPSAFKPLIVCQAESNLRDKLRYVIFGGEALEPAILQPWYATRSEDSPVVVNMYGITETTVHVTYRAIKQQDCTQVISPIGARIPDLTTYILDTYGRPVPLGVAGELYIGGSGVTRGYLNRPELTAERFPLDPFTKKDGARMYRTGDLGRFLPDGGLIFLGRNDHQVKIRGFRIELGEIEARLVDHPLVKDAAVFALGDGSDKRLVAYVVAEPMEDLAQTLRSHAAARLPDYMIPTAFVRLDVLPLTANGKLDRRALPEPDSEALVTEKYEAPEGATETALAVIWAELLKISRVGRHDNFFMLGGHSLLAVQMIERLRRIGLGLSIRALFEKPTLSALALSLNQYQTEAATPQNLITPDTTRLTPEMLPLIDLTQDDIDNISKQVKGGVSNIQDIYSLAPLQDGILFHHLLATKGDPYLLILSMAFDSKELLDRYLDAVQRVVNRHDILRTAIMWEDLSSPAQVVLRDAPLSITELSLNPADGPIVDQLVELYDPRQHRIDLTQAPLLRFVVAQDVDDKQNEPSNGLKGGRWILIQLMHHIIDDNSSLKQMNFEIQAFLEGRGESLPAPQPFRNLIAQTRSGPNDAAHERFFTKMLSEIDTPSLPYGLSDVHGEGLGVLVAQRMLAQDLNVRLRDHAKRFGVSLASLCHLAWAQVIAQTSGQQRVVFGTVLFGRMRAGSGSETSMGPFINTLPIRIDLDRASVQESVLQTHAALAALLEHEHASLALAQRCSSVPTGIPLFSALLNYRHQAEESEDTHGIVGMEMLDAQERTNYPFSLDLDDSGSSLELTVEAVQPFDATRICSYMHQALQSLAEALENNPEWPVHRLDVVPVEEHKLLVETWNATQQDYPEDRCIHQLFELQAAKTPDACALVFEDQVLSYGDLNARSNRLAHRLIELGVRPDSRVAICVDRTPAMIVGLLATMKAGGAYVPLDPAYPSDRLAYILADSAPTLLLADDIGRAALSKAGPISLTVLDPNHQPASAVINPHVPDLTSRHLAYVIYTSGSTGKPKGVMVEHQGVTNFAFTRPNVLGVNASSRVLLFASFSFDVSVDEIFPPLCVGASLYLLPNRTRFDSSQLWRYLEEHSITIAMFTPSMLLDFKGLPPLNSPLTLVLGGEALPLTLLKTLKTLIPHGSFVNAYGPTETTVDAATWRFLGDFDGEIVPIGRPIANKRTYILDSYGKPVPLGAIGELHVGGVGVARGYINRSDLTAKVFIPDPFAVDAESRMYKTGDLARYLPSGDLVFMGRNDHQVKIRGFRIELGEIEARLKEYPTVSDAVVLALGEGVDKRLVAYVVSKPQNGLVLALHAHLATNLAAYMIPSAFVRLDAFPLTPNDKLDRQALPEPSSDAFVVQEYEAPEGEIETALAAIWAELLKVDRVGRHDNFFMLGGHSLLAVRLISQIRSRLGFGLELRTVFEALTLEKLARKLQQQDSTQGDAFSVLLPLNPSGSRSPLFCIHPVLGLSWSFIGLAKHLHADQPLYGIQARGLDGKEQPASTLEAMTRDYIDQIRLVQPQGPYNLLGWSFGGTVAHSMAVQLEAQGHKVGLLALMDTTADYSVLSEDLDDGQDEDSYADLLSRFSNKDAPEDGRALLEKARHIVRNNIQLAKEYSPSVYSGDLLYFSATVRAADDETHAADPAGWAPLALGKVEVHKVNCAHLEMDQPEPIAEIGRVIYSKLEELQ